MSRRTDFRNFPISEISGGLLCGIGSSKKKGHVRVDPFNLGGLGGGGMIPQKIGTANSNILDIKYSCVHEDFHCDKATIFSEE